ncbi:hypothetical protein BDW59DRAFT_168126 [Aspergillus cavernicola]|uniref:PNPLA domain-containing protein n=1 Tax=Aspergillus cavernicola TaxID=176166 RepID=A0ABR4H4W5_9EURO
MARHQRLQLEIRRQNQQMFDIRQRNHMLLSAFHLASLFATAVEWTARSTCHPFNFITASRIHNEVGSDYLEHLGTFLQLARHHKTEYNSVALLIASSIIMDAYPPRMHREFPSSFQAMANVLVFPIEHVFNLLYHDVCYKVLALSYNELFARHLCGEIERHCIQQFERLNSGFISSSRLHWGTIRRLDKSIHLYRTNTTCLFCLRRLPEYHLCCGHCVCRECILTFGVMHPGREDRFKLHCIYDDRGELTVDLKPKTAGIRAIGIDGGGVRGATSLEFLKELQKTLLHCPLHEMVDIAGSTSSGGLIALAKFHLQWTVERCSETFESFAIRCLQRSKSMLGVIKSAVKYAVKDAVYDEAVIDSLMKDTYGSSTVFFGNEPNTIHGTRVAVTAMTHASQRVIFTNYNGSTSIRREDAGCYLTPRFQDTSYIAIRPKDISKEPLLWEVARATSAAPL